MAESGLWICGHSKFVRVSAQSAELSSSVWGHAPLEFQSITGLFSNQSWHLRGHTRVQHRLLFASFWVHYFTLLKMLDLACVYVTQHSSLGRMNDCRASIRHNLFNELLCLRTCMWGKLGSLFYKIEKGNYTHGYVSCKVLCPEVNSSRICWIYKCVSQCANVPSLKGTPDTMQTMH